MTNASGKTLLAPRLNRRSFIGSTAALGGTTALMIPPANAATSRLQGYTTTPSVAAGGTIDFFLSDPAAGSTPTQVSFTVTRVDQPDVYVTSAPLPLNVVNQGVAATASTAGCGWTRTFQLTTQSTWPSGLYYAYISSTSDGSNAYTVPFVVRAVGQTAGVQTIVNIPMLTAHAYNEFGGKSIYDYNSTANTRASRVSLDRPFSNPFSFFDVWSQYLVRWMNKNGIAADFCTDWDIETNPSILNGYQLYVQAGHDEYWSSGRRDTMDAFVARGGNCAYLGGNTAWFQSRLEPGTTGPNRTLVSYKDAAADPVQTPALKTINWINLVPPRPENQTTGLGFLTGCSWASASLPRPVTPSVVQRPEHWAFAGTGLAQGAGFGGTYVGYECDCAAFTVGTDARPYPTAFDGTPPTLRILSQADGSTWNAKSIALGGSGEASGYSAVAVFCRGGTAGTVFNVGTTDWAYGLRPELDGQTPTPISRITLNVLTKLVRPWTESVDVRQFHLQVGNTAINYLTTGTTAPAGSGMALDGWVFRAFVAPVGGSVPVYRYRTGGSDPTRTTYYLRTGTVAPASTVLDGVSAAFHAYPAPRSDAAAVYEHYAANATLGAIVTLYSTSPAPPTGWNAGPIVFYAPTDAANPTQPPVVPGFTLLAAASSLTLAQGRSATDTITVVPVNGFTGTVVFSATGLPQGATATFAATSAGSTLTLAAGATTPPGSYPLTITGSAPNTTGPASIGLTLTITAAPVQSFTLTSSTGVIDLPLLGLQGGSATIGIAGVNGFGGTVSFSASGVPGGFVASLSPASSTSGTRLTITRALFPIVPPGNYTVTVIGTSGSLRSSTSVVLAVRLLF